MGLKAKRVTFFTLILPKIMMYVRKGWELAALTLCPQISSPPWIPSSPATRRAFPRD